MEKVLRKVSVKDRLPDGFGYYHTDKGLFIFYPNKSKFFDDYENLPISNVEYWYEEVSLDELLKEAFNAGRARNMIMPRGSIYKYVTFEDFFKKYKLL